MGSVKICLLDIKGRVEDNCGCKKKGFSIILAIRTFAVYRFVL